MTPLEYLELIAIERDRIRGQIVLESVYKLDPDADWYAKQNEKIARYERKIIAMTRERSK